MAHRDPFAAHPVKSRRGGPVKEPLSREAIVAAALDLLTRHGLEGMSLRRIAGALDTGAASLYAYVEDLRELQALVLDRALASVRTPRTRGHDWHRRLKLVLESYFQALFRSPGLAQLAMATIAAGPNALRIVEALLELLDEGGVEPATAAWAVDLLLLYATAIAAEQSSRRDRPDPIGPLSRAIGAVPAEQYPRIHAIRKELLSGGGRERFAWSIDVVLAGLFHGSPSDTAGGGREEARATRGKGTPR